MKFELHGDQFTSQDFSASFDFDGENQRECDRWLHPHFRLFEWFVCSLSTAWWHTSVYVSAFLAGIASFIGHEVGLTIL